MGYADRSKQTTITTKVAPHNPSAASSDKFPSFLSPVHGESVVLSAHPSAMNFLWFFIFGTILIPLFFIGVAIILYAVINLKTTCIVVTNKRVVLKTGWLSVNQTEVRISDIRGVNLQRSLWQRVIGTGNLTIGTAATGGAEIVMLGVGNPCLVVERINAQRNG